MYLSENDMHWVDKTTDMLIRGELKIPMPSMGKTVLSLFDHYKVFNLKEGITPEEIADYELMTKRMLVKHFVREAYEKMMPIFNAYILKERWEQTWYDFVITQLYITH